MSNENPVGCVPLHYSAFRRRDPDTYSETQMYTEIAEAGYVGIPVGPYSDETPESVSAKLARFHLRAAPAYLPGGEPWKPSNRAGLVEKAKRFATFAAEVGVSECFVDADGWGYHTQSGRTRPELAGRITPADSLTEDEFKHLADSLNSVGGAMLSAGNVRACLHNHVGTVIETEYEYELILSLTDPKLVFAGPDTGHLAWAGADAAAFMERNAFRVGSVHLKDIHESVRLRGISEGWNYDTFTQNGLFAECGEGVVNFPRLLAALKTVRYSGWLLVETDVTTKATPRESLVTSREYLRSLGY